MSHPSSVSLQTEYYGLPKCWKEGKKEGDISIFTSPPLIPSGTYFGVERAEMKDRHILPTLACTGAGVTRRQLTPHLCLKTVVTLNIYGKSVLFEEGREILFLQIAEFCKVIEIRAQKIRLY